MNIKIKNKCLVQERLNSSKINLCKYNIFVIYGNEFQNFRLIGKHPLTKSTN